MLILASQMMYDVRTRVWLITSRVMFCPTMLHIPQNPVPALCSYLVITGAVARLDIVTPHFGNDERQRDPVFSRPYPDPELHD